MNAGTWIAIVTIFFLAIVASKVAEPASSRHYGGGWQHQQHYNHPRPRPYYNPYIYPYGSPIIINPYPSWQGIRPGFQPWRLYHKRNDGLGY